MNKTEFKLLHYVHRYDIGASLIIIKVDSKCDFEFHYSKVKYDDKHLSIEHIKTIELDDNTSINFLIGFDMSVDKEKCDLHDMYDGEIQFINEYFKKEINNE